MRKTAIVAAFGLLIVTGSVQGAQAKGCIKGAVVGGVAGHLAGRHTVLGAAAGCAIGVHEAHKQAKQVRRAEQHPDPHAGH